MLPEADNCSERMRSEKSLRGGIRREWREGVSLGPAPALSHVSWGIIWLTAAYQASFWVSVRSCPCFWPARAKYISPLCKCSTSPATRAPGRLELSSSSPGSRSSEQLRSEGGWVCVRVCVCVCAKGLEVKRASLLVSGIQHSFLAFSSITRTYFHNTHIITATLVKLGTH